MLRRRAIRTGVGAALAAAWLLANAAPSAAEIRVDASASDADKKALTEALAELQKNPLGKVIVDSLERHGRTVTITFTKTPLGEEATPSDEKGASLGADGKTVGRGSDSTVIWNPSTGVKFPDQGIPVYPPATLLHELSHALDFAHGRDDAREHGRTGISEAEVRATRDENVFRAWKDLPQRTMYGGEFLPPDALVKPKPPPPTSGGDEGGAPSGGGSGGGTGGGPPGGGTGGGGTTGGDTTGGTTGGDTTGGTTGGDTTGGTTGGDTTGGTTGGDTTGGTTGGGTTGGDTTGGTTGGDTTGGGTTGGG